MAHRLLCDVLEEMRKAYETRNFSYLLGLIEEAQTMANKMEAKIATIHDFERLSEAVKDLREKKRELGGTDSLW